MDLTKLKVQSAVVTSLNFEDFTAKNEKSSSGFLRIMFDREDNVMASKDSMFLFFSGSIAAYEGEESESPEDSRKVFSLNIKFTIRYSGEFDVDALTEPPQEGDWFFKKDASTFLHSVANRFLSDTDYKSVVLPYQQ